MPGHVADQIASALHRYGVENIFGQSLPTSVLLSAASVGIRQVFYRTENAGGAMADGYARISRKIGVVTAQNGPAATLLVAPLAEAFKASVPLLALVQEVPRRNRDRNAFQELDHRALFAACSKWVGTIDCPERVEADLAHAITRATTGRPGPVVLLLPPDTLSAPAVDQPPRGPGLGRYPLDRPQPERRATERAAELLATCNQPLVVAGGGVHLSGAAQELARLQEVAAVPVATTTMGKGAVDEGHELSVGVIGSTMGINSLTRSMRDYIRGADAIVLAGTRTNENGTDSWTLFPEQARYVHLDIAPDEVGRNYDGIRLVGDVRSGLEDLLDCLLELDLSDRRARRAGVAAALAEARKADREKARTVMTSPASPMRPERVASLIDLQLTGDDIVVADASYSSIWMSGYLRARRPGQRFLSPRGLAGLGWGLPLAIGAKIARPSSRVVCLVGDGAFGHTWQELETVVREELPITIVLLNNGVLGFQKHAELHTFGTHTNAVTFSPVDHVAIARACGATGVRVDRGDDFTSALEDALKAPGATLIEVVTDPGAHPPITAWDHSRQLEAALSPAMAAEG